MKLIDKKNRSILGEGRSHQMGFAFLKKHKTQDTYTTVQPISTCKDYLNDVVWSEHTGKEITAYGLKYKKKNIFDKTNAYIVLSILPYKGGNEYPNYHQDIKNLAKNYKLLNKFINYFDEKLGMFPSEITEVEPNKYIVKFDYKWCKSTYGISLFSLLLRAGQFYKKGDCMKYLKEFQTEFPPDNYLVLNTVPKLAKFIADKSIPDQELDKLEGGTTAHNYGIMHLNIN